MNKYDLAYEHDQLVCVQTEDGYDFVMCSNCDFQGEVPAGEDVCPSCASDGALMRMCEGPKSQSCPYLSVRLVDGALMWTCEVPRREGNPNDAD